MTFCENVTATLVGTTSGFVFAVALFYLTEYWKRNSEKTNLLKNLKREFKYNLALISGWIEEYDKILRKMTTDDLQVYPSLKYTYFQRYFVQTSFGHGILYAKLTDDDDVSGLNTILVHFDSPAEQYILNLVNNWKNGTIDKVTASRAMEFEKDLAVRYKKTYETILQKL